jgi:hypothetical protein
LLDDLREKDEPWRALALGAVIGVAFLAKYTAILAVPIAVLYLAGRASTRRWLRRPSFYLAGVVALAFATPVLIWNHLHHWPSPRLHLSERMMQPRGESLAGAMLRVASGQILLYQPLILPALLAVLGYALYRSRSDERYRLLATASLPTLAFLLCVMVRAGDSEPHWTLVAYMPLAVAAGGILDEASGPLRRAAENIFRASLLLSAALVLLYAWHLRSTALMRAFPSYNPNADPYVETIGWHRVGAAIVAHADRLGPRAVVAGAHNVLCGHIQSELDDVPRVYCPSPRRTEFDFMGRRSPPGGAPIVFVNSDRYPDDPASALPQHRCALAQDVELKRSGRSLARYHVFECLPLAGSAP